MSWLLFCDWWHMNQYCKTYVIKFIISFWEINTHTHKGDKLSDVNDLLKKDAKDTVNFTK